MNKEHRILLKMGLSLSLLTISLNTHFFSPTIEPLAFAREENPEQSHTINQEALAFIKTYAKPENYRNWSEAGDLHLSDEQKEEIKQFIENNIVKDPQAKTVDKAEQIFNWIKTNVKYPQADQIPSINPYQVFKNKLAVCGGYSNLYKTMLNAVDIPSVIVYGTIPANSSNGTATLDPAHQWNAIYVDGEWFYSDSTWGGDYFKKPIADFSTNHRTTNIHQVHYEDNRLTLGFEQGGLALVAIPEDLEELIIPSHSMGKPIQSLSTNLPRSNSNLKQLTFSNQLKQFEGAALQFPNLESIVVDPTNPVFSSRDGVLFSKELSTILHYPTNKIESEFTLPKETNSFDAKQTFQNKHLVRLKVEEENPHFTAYMGALFTKDKRHLLTIPDGAKEVTIPKSTLVDNSGLSFKPNLERIIFEEGVTYIPEGTFYANPKLTEIYFPTSLQEISDKAFDPQTAKQVTLVAKTNSTIDTYAKRHGISFRSSDENKPLATVDPVIENQLLVLIDYLKQGKIEKENISETIQGITQLSQSLEPDNPLQKRLEEMLMILQNLNKTTTSGNTGNIEIKQDANSEKTDTENKKNQDTEAIEGPQNRIDTSPDTNNSSETEPATENKNDELKITDTNNSSEAELAMENKNDELKVTDTNNSSETELASENKNDELKITDTNNSSEAELAMENKNDELKVTDTNNSSEAELAMENKNDELKATDTNNSSEAELAEKPAENQNTELTSSEENLYKVTETTDSLEWLLNSINQIKETRAIPKTANLDVGKDNSQSKLEVGELPSNTSSNDRHSQKILPKTGNTLSSLSLFGILGLPLAYAIKRKRV